MYKNRKNVNFTCGGDISLFFEDKSTKWPIAPQKKNQNQNIHSQLIHMTLQEGMVIKDI